MHSYLVKYIHIYTHYQDKMYRTDDFNMENVFREYILSVCHRHWRKYGHLYNMLIALPCMFTAIINRGKYYKE